MFQTVDNSQLCTQYLTIGARFKHKNTQPLYIFNIEDPQNSEPQNGPMRGLDFIALQPTYYINWAYSTEVMQCKKER